MITDDALWGWDPTPGIVSVWAEPDGAVTIWRRVDGTLVREEARFRPWAVLDRRDDVSGARVSVRELAGPGELRYLVRADHVDALTAIARQSDAPRVLLSPEEQYLVATGRTYFKDLAFNELRRMQIDLETTGLDPERDRIFLIAMRDPDGGIEILEGNEPELIAQLVERVRAADPDVIENR